MTQQQRCRAAAAGQPSKKPISLDSLRPALLHGAVTIVEVTVEPDKQVRYLGTTSAALHKMQAWRFTSW